MGVKKPELDEATRQIAERMLSMPPKRHEDMKIGKRAKTPKRRLSKASPKPPEDQEKDN